MVRCTLLTPWVEGITVSVQSLHYLRCLESNLCQWMPMIKKGINTHKDPIWLQLAVTTWGIKVCPCSDLVTWYHPMATADNSMVSLKNRFTQNLWRKTTMRQRGGHWSKSICQEHLMSKLITFKLSTLRIKTTGKQVNHQFHARTQSNNYLRGLWKAYLQNRGVWGSLELGSLLRQLLI